MNRMLAFVHLAQRADVAKIVRSTLIQKLPLLLLSIEAAQRVLLMTE
jgi:hypothetical protein